jgi:hypothetical protein
MRPIFHLKFLLCGLCALLRKYQRRCDLGDFRHTGEKPVSILSRPCMPASAGMKNQGRNHVVLGTPQFQTF